MNELLMLLIFETFLVALLMVLLLASIRKSKFAKTSVKEDLKKIKEQVYNE